MIDVMSSNYSKVYVKFGSIEITIEGDDNFVSEQFQNIFNLQNTDNQENFAEAKQKPLSDQQNLSAPSFENEEEKDQNKKKKKKQKTKEPVKESTKSSVSDKVLNAMGTNFEKWLANLPSSSETRDKILIAAYYNQAMNSEKKFYMRGIKAIFKEHGITIPNISNFLDTFEIQKIIAKVADSSRKGYQFTKEGKKYIEDLFAIQISGSI